MIIICNSVAKVKEVIIIARRYITKHREEILRFLEERNTLSFSAGEIYRHLVDKGIDISITTVYRQLDSMVESGMIKMFYSTGKGEYCYRYLNLDCRKIDYFTFHCEKCGKVINIDREEMEQFKNIMLSKYSFKINTDNSVLSGICGNCI